MTQEHEIVTRLVECEGGGVEQIEIDAWKPIGRIFMGAAIVTQEQAQSMDDMAEAADGVQVAMDEAEFARKQAAIAAGLVQARIGGVK